MGTFFGGGVRHKVIKRVQSSLPFLPGGSTSFLLYLAFVTLKPLLVRWRLFYGNEPMMYDRHKRINNRKNDRLWDSNTWRHNRAEESFCRFARKCPSSTVALKWCTKACHCQPRRRLCPGSLTLRCPQAKLLTTCTLKGAFVQPLSTLRVRHRPSSSKCSE